MYGAVGLRPELFLATNKRSGTEAQCHLLSTETAVVFKNHPIPVISTDQREWRNLSISRMLALPKVTDRPTMSFTYFVANDLIFLERRDSNGHGYKPQRGDIYPRKKSRDLSSLERAVYLGCATGRAIPLAKGFCTP